MPETPDKTTVPHTPEEVAKANAETAAKLAAQGNDLNKPANEADFRETNEGLDKLAEEIVKKKEPIVDEAAAKAKVEADRIAAEAAAKADPKAVEEAAAKEAERKALEERSETFFKDSPKLPPNVSPKSTDAFREVKIRAAQEIVAREAEIEKLKKELAEQDEKLKNPIPPETEAEIKELREFRARLDVETDPKFKEFDKSVESTREFIYDQLRKSPNIQADKLIEKIKSLGGPEMVEWTKVWEGAKDPTMQRIVESSIAEIEKIKFLKAQAVQTAKKNVDQYIKERETQAEKAVTGHNEATKQHLSELLGKMDFLKEKPLDPKADEATKKQVEAENTWVKEMNAQIQEALTDDTPQMRALLVAGMAQLLYDRRVREAEAAVHEKVKKERDEAVESLKKIKSASVNRIRENGAPPDGKLPQPKKDEANLFNTPATHALDMLAKEIVEKRHAAAA